MNKMKHKMTSMKMIVAFASIAALSACTGGDGSISIGSTSSSSSSEPGSISVTSFKGIDHNSWQIESGTGAIQTATGAISFAGSCTRGVNKIIVKTKLHAAGSYTDTGITADCLNQAFSWTGAALSSDNYYDYQLYGVNGAGIEQTDKAVVKTVKLDTTAPTQPTGIQVEGVSVADGGTETLTSGEDPTTQLRRVDITGVISTDTKRMVATTGCTAGSFAVQDHTGIGAFTYTIYLPRSSNCPISFVAYDDLGNASTDYSVTVAYTPPLDGVGVADTFYMNFNSGSNFTPTTISGATMVRAGVASFEGGATISGSDFRAGVISYLGQIQ